MQAKIDIMKIGNLVNEIGLIHIMLVIVVGIQIGLENVPRMPAKIDIMKIGDLVSEVGLASLY